MDGHPLVTLALSSLDFLELVDADLRIKGARSYDGAELRPRPLDLPRGSALNFDGILLAPFIAPLGEHANCFVAASGGKSPASPVKTHIVNDDGRREIANHIDASLRIHVISAGEITTIINFNMGWEISDGNNSFNMNLCDSIIQL